MAELRITAAPGRQEIAFTRVFDAPRELAFKAKEHAGCTRSETMDLINDSVAPAVDLARSLTDEQLERKVLLMDGMPEITVEMMIQLALVGHASAHLATISGAR